MRRSRATTRSRTTPASSARTRSRHCGSSTSNSVASSAPRRYAPRPYEIVVLSDHGQTQGATFKQRNGYGLDELVERSLAQRNGRGGRRRGRAARDGRTRGRRGHRPDGERRRPRVTSRRKRVVVLGSGNLGLDLADGGAAPAHARGDRRAAPAADPGAPRAPAHRLAPGPLVEHGAVALGAAARTTSPTERVEGEDPLAASRRMRRATCSAPTASRTSPTSWSAASTTPISKRAAHSRS